jgi:hypothetical protein
LVTLYVAGGIAGLSDADAKNWREYSKLRLDPRLGIAASMDRDYRGQELVNAAEIVEGDKLDEMYSAAPTGATRRFLMVELLLLAVRVTEYQMAVRCYSFPQVGGRTRPADAPHG